MKKTFGFYAICWLILLALFNVICFVTPGEINGYSKFDGAFWPGYIIITVAFIGQLACAFFAFRAENLRRMFYNIPLITVSYTGLILTVLFGCVCMGVPYIPDWVGIIVCLLILGFSAIAVFKSAAAAVIVDETDKKIKAKTVFIKMSCVDAENIVNIAKDNGIKVDAVKVLDALRYSDPMSCDELISIEAQITSGLTELEAAVRSNEAEKVSSLTVELLSVIKNRNAKCKALK